MPLGETPALAAALHLDQPAPTPRKDANWPTGATLSLHGRVPNLSPRTMALTQTYCVARTVSKIMPRPAAADRTALKINHSFSPQFLPKFALFGGDIVQV